MRNFFKYASMMAIAIVAAASFASCSDDDTEGGGTIPQPKISEVTVDGMTATLTVTPPAGATSIYWAVAESGKTPKDFTQVAVESAEPIDIAIPELNYGKWKIYAFAKTAGGNSEIQTSKEFEIALSDLIGFRIINKTAYSLDVQVTMGADCEKYVIGAFSNGSYNEKYFIESAKNSLSPNASYPMQPFNIFETDAVIPESMLTKYTLQSSNESKGITINRGSRDDASAEIVHIKYQVAIYAIDKQGEGHVFTSEEFEVPEAEFGETPAVKITAESTLTTVTATYTVTGDCKKLIRGFVVPYENTDVDWTDKAATEAALATLAVSNPPYLCLYDGQRFREEVPKDMRPSSDVIVYAAGITEDGRIGKLVYEKFQTKTPILDGTGTAEVTYVSSEEKSMRFKATLGNNASSVRIILLDDMEYAKKQNDLDWIFVDPELVAQNGVEKNSYQLNYGADKDGFDIPCPAANTTYKVFAAAVTRDGKVSKWQKVGEWATKKKDEPIKIDFSKGIGEATLTTVHVDTFYSPGDEWGTSESWSVDYTYTITKGANTKTVWLLKLQDTTDSKEAVIKAILNNSSMNTDVAMRNRTPFTEFGIEKTQTNMMDVDPTWGGSVLAVVTEDNDGNFSVAAYYAAVADHTVKDERK